tara:strand:- start:38 stop:316 length:279 start_codon:yes stop_codon:yes gene_type:complete
MENKENLKEEYPDISGLAGLSEEEIKLKIEESELNALRQTRNYLLQLTDWTQLSDVPQLIKDKYKNYRQALRDITKTYKNTSKVVWPDEPKN